MYFACCLAITTLIYAAIDRVTVLALGGGMAVTIGIYMGINFHHYIVDALIWKRRKTLDLARARPFRRARSVSARCERRACRERAQRVEPALG
jgi:hypothetical protein